MAKEVRLFIGRDQRSLELFRMVNEVLGELPPGERPKLRVKTFKIKDPSQFKTFIKQLEELFGGMYTVEVRKYGINAIPAIVVDGEKVLEGEYPTPEKLRELLLGTPVMVAATPEPQTEQVQPISPVEPVSIETPTLLEEKKPEETAQPSPPRPPEPTPQFTPAIPVEEPEEFKLEDEEAPPPQAPPQAAQPTQPAAPTIKQQPLPAPQPPRPLQPPPPSTVQPATPPAFKAAPPIPAKPKVEETSIPPPPVRQSPSPQPIERVEPPKPPLPRAPVQPRIEQPTPRVQPSPSEKTAQPQAEKKEEIDLSKTCLTCIFYSKSRKRCTLYHIPIEDPYHPPPICERVKR